jgi:hypothetical protein
MGYHQRMKSDGTFVTRRKERFLMEQLSEVNDLKTYQSAAVQNLITYKWESYGFAFHVTTFLFLQVYVFLTFLYVENIYINFKYENVVSDEARAYHAQYTF